MIEWRSWIVGVSIVLVLLSGCLQPETLSRDYANEADFGDWAEAVDERVEPGWAICTDALCALRTFDNKNRVTFSDPDSSLTGVDLAVSFPHPDHPPPASATFQSLVVTVSCNADEAGDCGSFSEAQVFEGASPLPIVLDDLMLSPGSDLILEFRIHDPIPIPGVMFEFDAYAMARLHGSVVFHGPHPDVGSP